MARWRWSALGIGVALAGLPAIAAAPRLAVRALAPVEEVARGFDAPVGLAAGEAGRAASASICYEVRVNPLL